MARSPASAGSSEVSSTISEPLLTRTLTEAPPLGAMKTTRYSPGAIHGRDHRPSLEPGFLSASDAHDCHRVLDGWAHSVDVLTPGQPQLKTHIQTVETLQQQGLQIRKASWPQPAQPFQRLNRHTPRHTMPASRPPAWLRPAAKLLRPLRDMQPCGRGCEGRSALKHLDSPTSACRSSPSDAHNPTNISSTCSHSSRSPRSSSVRVQRVACTMDSSTTCASSAHDGLGAHRFDAAHRPRQAPHTFALGRGEFAIWRTSTVASSPAHALTIATVSASAWQARRAPPRAGGRPPSTARGRLATKQIVGGLAAKGRLLDPKKRRDPVRRAAGFFVLIFSLRPARRPWVLDGIERGRLDGLSVLCLPAAFAESTGRATCWRARWTSPS